MLRILIILLLIVGCEEAVDYCNGKINEQYEFIDGSCYYKSDLEFIQDFENDCGLPYDYGGGEYLDDIDGLYWNNNSRIRKIQFKTESLTCEIPESIGNLTELVQLWLSNNQLYGEIPASFSNLTELERLSLYNNNFTGSIENIVYLKSLRWLSLSFNEFSGEIPEGIGSLTNLYQLHIQNNQLSGTIPESICNLQLNWSGASTDNISYISNNKLCPPYPSCIEDFVGTQDTSECEYCIENPTEPLCN